VFWLDPQAVAPRVSVSVTSMLTLVAYRFLLGGDLPKISYLTRLDYFLLGATILVFLALIEVTWTSAMSGRGRTEAARRLDRSSRWLFPAMFLALSVLSFWA
jgi:cadmium resistance protein CadD (predicted permease)